MANSCGVRPGRRAQIPSEVRALGLSRVVVICTPGRKPFADAVAAELGSAAVAVHSSARMHVPVETVDEGRCRIRVNAVSPAMTATPHTAPLLADPHGPFAGQVERIPMGRVGRPEDVANAVLFLASDEAAHVSGANLPVDGGAAAIG